MDEILKQELLYSGLKEISNIGTGNAISTLAEILDIPIEQLVPESKIVSFLEIHETVDDPDEAYLCALADIDGDVDGMICVLFKTHEFKRLVDYYKSTKSYKSAEGEFSGLSDEDFYTVLTDKLSEKYLDAIRKFLNVKLNRYEMNVFTDGLVNILSIPAMKFIGVDESLSITHTTFSFKSFDGSYVVGNVVYIPGTTAIKKVMQKLMVM